MDPIGQFSCIHKRHNESKPYDRLHIRSSLPHAQPHPLADIWRSCAGIPCHVTSRKLSHVRPLYVRHKNALTSPRVVVGGLSVTIHSILCHDLGRIGYRQGLRKTKIPHLLLLQLKFISVRCHRRCQTAPPLPVAAHRKRQT